MPSSKIKNSSKGNSPIVVIIIILVILFVVGGYLYWVWKAKQPAPSATTPTPTSSESATPAGSPTGSPTGSPKATKSPTPTPTPAAQSMTLTSNGQLDGFESSNGGGNTTVDVRAGRNSNLITRGFVSFDIPSSLKGKTIEKATLRLYQGDIVGSPYTAGSSVKVDHLDYGNSLENGDYSASSLSSSFGTLTSNAAIEYKDLDVTDRLKDDLSNNRQRSQYRIHLAIENIGGDVTGDFAYFESQDNSMATGNRPQIVVTYR